MKGVLILDKPFEIKEGDIFYYVDNIYGAFKVVVSQITATPVLRYVTLTADMSESLRLNNQPVGSFIWLDSTVYSRINKSLFFTFEDAVKVIK